MKKNRTMRRMERGNESLRLDKPFYVNGQRIIPVRAEAGEEGLADAEQFMRSTHNISDAELNRLMYMGAKEAVEEGTMEDWPEDDFGMVMWFTWNFITPEMRDAFPEIAREFLKNEPMVGEHAEFLDIAYPITMEKTWDDAFYFRILEMMVYSARRGSTYSKNILLALYKVYYKREYNRLKRFKTINFLDFLQLFDEDCHEKGYASAHTTNGEVSFSQQIIEKRRHEAGWTDVFRDRLLTPNPAEGGVAADDGPLGDVMAKSRALVASFTDAPNEPPLQPVASRVFIMCQLMGIEIDATCNREAVHMNLGLESILNLEFLTGPVYRKHTSELTERIKEWNMAEHPEMADPYLYQTNEKYLALQMAEEVMLRAFMLYGRNHRLAYDSREFDLSSNTAKAFLALEIAFPGLEPGFNDMMYLSMIQYLSECLCDVLIARDREIEELLHFHRRIHEGEWIGEVGQDIADEGKERKSDSRRDKVVKTVEGLGAGNAGKEEKAVVAAKSASVEKKTSVEDSSASDTVEDLKAQIEALKAQLDEKDAALAEAEQKVIRQRTLYEKAHEHETELEKKLSESEEEHTELVALREFAHGLEIEPRDMEELPEADRNEMVAALQDKKVTVLGGTERWTKKMKQLFPKWTFISVGDHSLGAITALEKANFIYIYTNSLMHKQYYKAMSIIKEGNKMLYYLGTTNIEKNIEKFYKDLCIGPRLGQ